MWSNAMPNNEDVHSLNLGQLSFNSQIIACDTKAAISISFKTVINYFRTVRNIPIAPNTFYLRFCIEYTLYNKISKKCVIQNGVVDLHYHWNFGCFRYIVSVHNELCFAYRSTATFEMGLYDYVSDQFAPTAPAKSDGMVFDSIF